jgi:hypothetical protein
MGARTAGDGDVRGGGQERREAAESWKDTL